MIKKLIVMGLLCSFQHHSMHKRHSILTCLLKRYRGKPHCKRKSRRICCKDQYHHSGRKKKLMEEELVVLQARNLDKVDFDREKAQIADRYSEKMDKKN